MSFKILPLSDVCGAEVIGVDMLTPLGAEDAAIIETAFDRFKVLVFRNQPLAARELADFSAQFGALQVHV